MIKKIFTVSVVVMTIFWAVGLAAFVPTAQAATISSGDLIKASLPAVYYYGADGKRYVFPNETTYKTWYPDFSGVKTITDGELAAITIGGNVTFRPGVKLVKITTDPKVYAVAANGTLRWLTTASIAASLYGANWGTMIMDVSDAFFVNYTIGAPINAVADYDPAAATAAAQSINVDKGLAGISTTGGNLQVSLAADTPASASVADGASANFTKITLAAGANAVKVKQIYVTRGGLSNNDDVLNVKLVASNGATVGDVGSFGANSKAMISFVPTLEIAANTTVAYYIRASVGDGVTPVPAGNTISLGIAAATDVVLEAGTVTGAFPVVGNYMSVVVLASLGTVQVGQDAAVVDSKPDAGAKRVLVSEFYVRAGANENLTVESMSLIEAGSANTADSANIELYSLTEGRTLGTAAAWDANSRATYGNLGVVIPKGGKHIFQAYIDIVSGSGQSIDVDLTDGADVLVTVKGNTYGFYLTPTVVAPWLGQGIDGVGGQTVNAGILNISKSSSTPAAGNITRASDQAITTFDYEARGESIKVTSTKVTVTMGASFNVANYTTVANIKIVDEAGAVIAGPKNLTGFAAGVATVTFNETYVVPTGTHKFTVKADVLSNAPAGLTATVVAGIANPAADLTTTGVSTRESIIPTPAVVVNGNQQTVLGVALSVTSLTQPASRSVATGSQDFVWATVSLDATASGEDVRVSALRVADNFTDGAITGNTVAVATVITTATAHGLVTGDTITITGSNSTPSIDGVRAVTFLTPTTFSIPVTVTVAGTAGTFRRTTGTATSGMAYLQNVEIWADLTSAASTRGDAYETKVSNSEQPVAGATTKDISLTQVITVAKGTFVKIAVVADLSTLAIVGGTHTINVPSNVTATGKASGNVPGTIYAGLGQRMTVSGAGTLTVSLDSNSPSKQILISGAQKQTVAVYKLSANNIESMDVDDITVYDVGVATSPVASAWYLYASKRDDGGSIADPIAIAPGGAVASFVLADNTVIIPANSSITVTVKADIAPVDGVTVVNGDALSVRTQTSLVAPFDVNVTGKASGLTIGDIASAAQTAIAHTAMASRPYFSLNAASPSGALVPGLATLLAIFDVKADAADDISWNGAGLPDAAGADTLTVELSDGSGCVAAGTGTASLEFKDEGGISLDVVAGPAAPGGAVVVAFANDFSVTKGMTKKLYVYGDTTSCTTAGDTLQVYFDSADIQSWSINYDLGGYNLGDVIFRGNLYANALVKG